MHKIEPSPSGRAACRGCKQAIAKGAPRFAEEVANAFSEDGGTSHRYWHLACAIPRLANEVGDALAAYDGPIDDRPAIDALITQHRRPPTPYAEQATTGRARCRSCDETIKKGEWRLAFERVFDSPMGPQKGAAFAHPRCLRRYLEREREYGRDAPDPEEVLRRVSENSRLGPDELDLLRREITTPP